MCKEKPCPKTFIFGDIPEKTPFCELTAGNEIAVSVIQNVEDKASKITGIWKVVLRILRKLSFPLKKKNRRVKDQSPPVQVKLCVLNKSS